MKIMVIVTPMKCVLIIWIFLNNSWQHCENSAYNLFIYENWSHNIYLLGLPGDLNIYNLF